MRVASTLAVIALSLGLTAACTAAPDPAPDGGTITATSTPDPAAGLLVSGRLLTPYGRQVELGNFPTGSAVTADGRFLWTVSTGFTNDVRVVDVATGEVCQTLPLPGASGGVALDSAHNLAYVSGVPLSAWMPTQKGLTGTEGDVVLVYSWGDTCGEAALQRTISVPPPKGSPPAQQWPPISESQRPSAESKQLSWPQKLAVSPDGSRLLVPLNLVGNAAVVDVSSADEVRYVPTGRFPFAAAITPDGTTGLVTNEAAGTVSVVDLATATKTADVVVGTGLSHAQAVVVDSEGDRAYVSLSESDEIVVVDIADREVERTIAVGVPAGLGTRPVALALGPQGDRLYVAQSGSDEITVVQVAAGDTATEGDWTVVGRIPATDQPQTVAVTAPSTGTPQLVYMTAKGVGVGPNPTGPNPTLATDPIFAAFMPTPPTTDIFTAGPATYDPTLVTGMAGIGPVPSDNELVALTTQAEAQLIPVGSLNAPSETVVRSDGPIEHVFFVVRENRSYDQMLGDLGRGNSDPALNVFDASITPNMHALVNRFPLLDNTYANSEASIEGHMWTSATTVTDYVNRNWIQNYASRGRQNDFGVYAVSWPGNGFLFDQAERQGITYFNYGEALADVEPGIVDVDRTAAQTAESAQVAANTDIGPPFGGCYPGSYTIGFTSDNKEIYDGSLPAGAPAGSYSHIDCFRERFATQLAAGEVPAFNYLSMTGDHTLGTIPGARTPQAMIADDDKALGELVETISNSSIWASSAIFVVEDDSQDGADHVAAHRIPALVISPYARKGAIVSTRYDLVSVVRTMELMLGMEPLTLNDALATPMYDAFTTSAVNLEPWTTIPTKVDLVERNTASSPAAAESAQLSLGSTDSVSQVLLDAILWKSVFGEDSAPPPPGPGSSTVNGIVDDD